MVFSKTKIPKLAGNTKQNGELRKALTPIPSDKLSENIVDKTKKPNTQEEKQPKNTKVQPQVKTKKSSPKITTDDKPNKKKVETFAPPATTKPTREPQTKNEANKKKSSNTTSTFPSDTTFTTNGVLKTNLQSSNDDENTPKNSGKTRKRKLGSLLKIIPNKLKRLSDDFTNTCGSLIDEAEFRAHLKSTAYKKTLKMLKKDPKTYERLKNCDRTPSFHFETPVPLSPDETEEIVEKYIRNRSQLNEDGRNNNNNGGFFVALTNLGEAINKNLSNPQFKCIAEQWKEVERRLFDVKLDFYATLTADDSKENNNNDTNGGKNEKSKIGYKRNRDKRPPKKTKKEMHASSLVTNETTFRFAVPVSEVPTLNVQNEKSLNGSSSNTTLETSSFRRRRLRKLYSDEEFLNSPEFHSICNGEPTFASACV